MLFDMVHLAITKSWSLMEEQKSRGAALVEHIKKYYKTDHVDYVVNTHPDADHASGLLVILENLSVGELWLHRSWENS